MTVKGPVRAVAETMPSFRVHTITTSTTTLPTKPEMDRTTIDAPSETTETSLTLLDT